jgi:hypothetical protein
MDEKYRTIIMNETEGAGFDKTIATFLSKWTIEFVIDP